MRALCPICQHAKIQAIDAALDSGRSPNLVRAQFRLLPQMLHDHIAHRAQETLAARVPDMREHLLQESLPVEPCLPETAMDALEPALPHIRRASRLVTSYDEYGVLVLEINAALCDGLQFVSQQLQRDDMGLS